MRNMKNTTLAALLAVACATIAAAQTAEAPAFDLQGKLYKSVFFSGAGVLAPADVLAVPEPLRARLTTYLSRRGAFKSGYKGEADSFEQVRIDAKRRLLEQSIVSLIDARGIERTAAEFVAAAPIQYEWKGLHQGPLDEANHAEAVLKKDPGSPLAPWFYVFIAQRQRVAFETYELEKNDDGMKAAAKKYRAFVERAGAVEDPIFGALIADMERQPYLYLKTAKHPRDYNPDA